LKNRTGTKGYITLLILAAAVFAAVFIGGRSDSISDAAGLFSTPVRADAQGKESLPDIIDRVSCSVVYIESKVMVTSSRGNNPMMNDPFWRRFFDQQPREREQQNMGSGVIISEEGYILTNNHLVGGATEVMVRCNDGKEYDAVVVGADAASDVAVLKVEDAVLNAIELGTSENLRLGETVIAIGYPFGIGQTVTRGIVSAQGASLGLVQYEDFIQTDAAINPGNSGGALINEKGQLIGINTAIASRSGGSHGIGFAIPIDFARSIMDKLIKDGRVVRGYVGIYPDDITADMVDFFDLDSKEGVLVTNVGEKTPAEKADLKRGDVIIEFDGTEITDVNQFRMLAANATPGETIEIVLVREGKKKTVELEIGERPTETAENSIEEDAEDISPLFLGVGLQSLQDEYREALELPNDLDGIIVTDVQGGTPAAKAGLRRGDVIVEVDKKQVENLDDFRSVMDDYDEDKVMVVIYRGGGYFYTMIRQ
jgi:Do/DeqQ family serine protease